VREATRYSGLYICRNFARTCCICLYHNLAICFSRNVSQFIPYRMAPHLTRYPSGVSVLSGRRYVSVRLLISFFTNNLQLKIRKFREDMDGHILSNRTSAPYALHVPNAPSVRLALEVLYHR